MAFLTEVTAADIERLGDVGLTDLLCRLIELDCDKHQIAARYHVNLKITIPDGGEDGRVAWDGGPDHTFYLPNRLVLFQVKAHIAPAELAKEVIHAGTNLIKPRIREVLEAGGAYFVLCGDILEKIGIERRIAALQESFSAHGLEIDDSKICVLDANGTRDWTNRYIAAVAFVLAKAGRHPPEGTDTWEGISQYPEHSYKYERGDVDRDAAEASLRTFLHGEEKIARVYGAAGLGKTRLVIEASRPSIDTPKLRGILFADANHSSAALPAFLKQCRQANIGGCLIVDNCDSDLHDALQRETNHSESILRLLTIGNDEKTSLSKIPLIELKPINAAVIKKQVASICPSLPSADIDFITDKLAEGFPQMAVLLAQARLNEVTDIRQIVGSDLLARLLGVDPESDPQTMQVLKACSIFERIGFDQERAIEYQTIAHFEGIDPDKFYSCLAPFIKSGVVNRRGRYIEIRPRPLAWRLAADWWASCSPTKALRLSSLELPEDMVTSLCARVRMLDGVPECVELTKNLCAPSGPFGQAELLNSEMGSKLFRAFCEVNPSACTAAIQRAFQYWTIDDLKEKVGPGRRNLVWALERLCFWADHFNDAGRVLLNFASSENETWSNNATGILTGFFSTVLSGTQATPIQRIALSQEALASTNAATQLVGVRCLSRVLESRHFSRVSGSEQQGGRPPMKDWQPKIWQEAFDYWDSAVNELIRAVLNDISAGAASLALIENLRNLFLSGRLDTISRALEILVRQPEPFTPQLVEALRTIEQFDLKKAPEEATLMIKDWQKRILPSEPHNQIVALVSQAPWDHEERNGEFIDVSAEKAIVLAHTLASRPKALISQLDALLFGEQRQTYVFAAKIGQETVNPCQLAISALRRYDLKPKDEWNASFIAGLLEGTLRRTTARASKPDSFLKLLATTNRFFPLLVPSMIAVGLDTSRLHMLEGPIADAAMEARHLRWLGSGRATQNIDTAALAKFCTRIASKGSSFAWAALDVLFMHCHGDSEKLNVALNGLQQVIANPVLFAKDYSPNTMDLHHFEYVATKLIDLGDDEISSVLASQIVQICSAPDSRFTMLDSLGKVAHKLLQKKPEMYWPILADPLLSNQWHIRNAMAQTLGSRLGNKSGNSAINEVPLDVLMSWCESNQNLAPQALVENAPLFDAEESQEFSGLVTRLLLRYEGRTDVLSALGVNMFSFGWSGSPIFYYERLKTAAGKLLQGEYSLTTRNWARERISELNRLIDKQKIEDDEGF